MDYRLNVNQATAPRFKRKYAAPVPIHQRPRRRISPTAYDFAGSDSSDSKEDVKQDPPVVSTGAGGDKGEIRARKSARSS